MVSIFLRFDQADHGATLDPASHLERSGSVKSGGSDPTETGSYCAAATALTSSSTAVSESYSPLKCAVTTS
jgi:hypothetical protein